MFGRDEKVSQFRLTAVQYIILAIFMILAYGLWRLQVVQSDMYASLAEKNRVRNVPILAPRGKILDREGRIIVDNYPSFTALLLRDSSRDLLADADLISQGLHLDPKETRDRIKHFASMPQYQPIFLKDDITPDELAFVESHRNELPELDTIVAHRRLYPRNGFMAHLIGYVGEVSEEMLNQPRWEFYNPGDVVGKSGVELQYNQILMGKNGSPGGLVDSRGGGRRRGRGNARRPGEATQTHCRSRSANCRRRGVGRQEWRNRGHGPAQRRNSGHGQPADFRSQRFCSAGLARSVEQAGQRRRTSVNEE